MHQLYAVDYAIIIGFLAITIIVGLYMTKRASSSLDHYFLGGRTMSWYLLGIAGMSNWFDMTGTMIITSFLIHARAARAIYRVSGWSGPRFSVHALLHWQVA